jgi:alpha-2-macroglobulin
MTHFAEKFEDQAVIGTTIAKLGQAKTEFDWKSGANHNAVASLSLPWPAKPAKNDKLALHHYGQGKPWASVQLLAAIPAGPARNAGYRVSRKLTPVQQKTTGKMSRGDLWRVTLTVDADDDMGWVALTDPIPAGAKIMGDGNGRDSAIASLGENNETRSIAPSYVERSFSAYRAYYAMLPKGRISIEYTLRLNNAGSFALPPTRVEAMYAPDVFAEIPNTQFIIVD